MMKGIGLMFIIIITLLIAVLIMEIVNFKETKEQLFKILPIEQLSVNICI